MDEPISSFRGEYFFLSNFFLTPVMYRGCVYPSVEHAFQGAKCLISADHDAVMLAATPGQVKRVGRAVRMRTGWDHDRLAVMLDLLRLKFYPGSPLAASLDATGSAPLVEGNTHGDTFWGVSGARGSNHLGVLLMQGRLENRVIAGGTPSPHTA